MAFQRLLWAVFATALFLSPARAAYDVGDIVCETSTTTGTGTLNLAGAVTNYATFVSQITSGSSVNYHITSSTGTLETGVGVFTDAGTDTLTRVAYWSTDGSGAELTLAAGTHTVCLGPTTQMFAGMKGFQLYTDDAGAVGGILPFWHDSASAADGDIAGEIQIWGGADDELIGQIQMEVNDGATTTEDTQWEFITRRAGADVTALTLSGDGINLFGGLGHKFDFSAQDFPSLQLENSSAATGGPFLLFYHNSATPLAADFLGGIEWRGEDSAGNSQLYTKIHALLLDPTSTSEDATLALYVTTAGGELAALTLGTSDAGGSAGSHTFSLGAGGDASVQIGSTSAGANGALLYIYTDSSTPAASDLTARIFGAGEDTAGNLELYSRIETQILDATSTSEDSSLNFKVRVAGADVSVLSLGVADIAGNGFGWNPALGLFLDNQTIFYLQEGEANGDNYKGFASPNAITSDTTCNFENDANFIPDSCVGDGSDASDGRIKTDLKPAGDVGALLDQIKIYDYAWTVDAPDESEDVRKGKRGFGPVAQELIQVNDDWVDVGGDNPLTDPWTWKPEKVVPYLIVEVQNLRKKLANSACYGIKLGNACIGVSM
jgi:hypothetical protein